MELEEMIFHNLSSRSRECQAFCNDVFPAVLVPNLSHKETLSRGVPWLQPTFYYDLNHTHSIFLSPILSSITLYILPIINKCLSLIFIYLDRKQDK